jgi:hypothetical protein
MKLPFILFIVILFGSACQPKKEEHHHEAAATEQPAADTIKKSIPKEEHAMVGTAHITISYYAPAVRGRQIWGGLVPYDEVWVTGAHRATSFEINKDFSIGDKTIPAGKYAIFTIPGKNQWTFIVNKNWEQHLADNYSQQEDVLRFQVTPEILDANQERLKYTITTITDNTAKLTISWEKISITIPIAIQ